MLVLKLTELCDFRLPVRPNAIHKCGGWWFECTRIPCPHQQVGPCDVTVPGLITTLLILV